MVGYNGTQVYTDWSGGTTKIEPPSGRLFTRKEAEAHLQVSRNTIFRLLKSGALKGRKVGSQWRFTLADLDAVGRTVQA